MPTNRLNVVICSFPVGSCYTTITHAKQYSATYTDLEFYDSSAKSRILTLAPFVGETQTHKLNLNYFQ